MGMSSILRSIYNIVEHIEIVDEMPYRMMMPYFGNIWRCILEI